MRFGAPTAWRRRLTGEQQALLGLGFLAFVVIVLVHPGRVYVDTRYDLYLAPGSLLRETLSTWVDGSGLGAANYNAGYLPVAALSWLLSVLGTPAWLVLRVWRLALVLAAGWGARRLLVDLTGGRDQPSVGAAGRVAAAVLYAANPYVVVGAATTPVMLPYALFPWLLLALRRSFGRSGWVSGVLSFALIMFLMGGINAGVVPAFLLLAVVPFAVDAVRREGAPVRLVLRGVGCSALATLLVSAYWIVGTGIALGTASAVAEATEDPRTVASVSSYTEVLRGLGSWLLYGADQLGPYRPGFVSYLDQPFVIIATFALPALALYGAYVTRLRARRMLVALALLGLVVMVGGYPPDHPSPFGRALLFAFDHVPGLVAFRTTSKAGALAMLALALLGALGVDHAWRRLRAHRRDAFVGGTAVLLVLSLTPVWFGDLLPGSVEVPDYWTSAAADLSARGDGGRVWAVPGESNGLYRWRPLAVDDVATSVIRRPVVYYRAYPDGPLGAWNAMSGIETGLDSGLPTGRLFSTYAQYLGVSDVLVRNDLIWEVMGSARPERVVAAAEADPGLDPSALYGIPGTNIAPSQQSLFHASELNLSPLIRYAVKDAGSPVRIYPASGQLLLEGDNEAVPSAIWAGLLDGSHAFRLLDATSAADVTAALTDGGRVVLTDSNRRRAVNVHRLDRSGPLVSADATLGGSTRATGEPDDQTVAAYTGIRDVTATSSGSVFGPTQSGRPFLAVDGRSGTAWTTGDYGNGVGQALTVDLTGPTRLRRIVVTRPAPVGAAVSEVRLDAGSVSAEAGFTGRRAVLTLPRQVSSSRLTVTLTAVSGRGSNQVGLSEVRIPGVRASESARLPRTLDRLAAADPDVAAALSSAPVDVLLTRAVIEGERSLDRTFTLPDTRSYRFRAEVEGSPRDWRACRGVLTVDGSVVRAKALGHRHADTGTVELRGCSELSLTAGDHAVATARRVTVDRALFASHTTTTPSSDRARNVRATGSGASYDVTVPAAGAARYLVLAEGLDPRWHAVIDGHDAGPPVQLNGFAMGWRLAAGHDHTVQLRFAPQGRFRVALLLSLLSVVVMAGCWFLPSVRRGRTTRGGA